MATDLSIVRENILTRPGYTPYCGNEKCRYHWPRTEFKRGQFECRCDWRSSYEPEFIARRAKENSDGN